MINLQIREDGAFVEIKTNGAKEFRQCDVDALINILTRAVRENVAEKIIESPMLPINTIKFDRNNTKDEYILYLYKEPVIDRITFESRSYTVGYPATVYAFRVQNNILTRVSAWAVKDQILNPKTQVYRYPFFNVFADGKVCIGSNRISIEEPWQLHKMPGILKAMPSNLGLKAHNQSGLEGDSLLKAVENKPFPDEWLLPLNKSLKKIFKEG